MIYDRTAKPYRVILGEQGKLGFRAQQFVRDSQGDLNPGRWHRASKHPHYRSGACVRPRGPNHHVLIEVEEFISEYRCVGYGAELHILRF